MRAKHPALPLKRKPERLYTVGDFWLVPPGEPDARYADYGICWYDRPARQTRRLGTGKTDFAEAKDVINEHALTHGDGEHKDELLLQTLERYYLAYAIDLPTEGKGVQQTIKFVAKYAPAAMVSGIDAPWQKKFVKDLRDYGLAEDSITRYLTNVFAAIAYALQFKHLKLKAKPVRLSKKHWGPRTQARIRQSTQPSRRNLSPEEWGQLFDAAMDKGEHCVRYLITAIATHGRPSAIRTLTGQQFDFAHGTVDLNPPGREQNDKRRAIIPMAPTCLAWAKSWQVAPQALVISDSGGAPMRSLKPIRTLIARAKMPNCIPYTFRHAVASWLATQGVDRWERKVFLGHLVIDGGSTDDYTHYEPQYLRSAAAAIERLFEAIAPHTRFNLLRKVIEEQGEPDALWSSVPVALYGACAAATHLLLARPEGAAVSAAEPPGGATPAGGGPTPNHPAKSSLTRSPAVHTSVSPGTSGTVAWELRRKEGGDSVEIQTLKSRGEVPNMDLQSHEISDNKLC